MINKLSDRAKSSKNLSSLLDINDMNIHFPSMNTDHPAWIFQRAEVNLMSLNLAKTKKLVIKTRTSKPPPEPVSGIKQGLSLKLLGVTFHDSPTIGTYNFTT